MFKGGAVTLNKEVGLKEIIVIFVLIGAIYGGIEAISRIAASVSSKQINEHTIVTEEKHNIQYEEMRVEQSEMKTDVEVTKERVNTIADDVKEIKELLKDR